MIPGEIYEVEVEIWPHCRVWHKGEKIRLEITGKYIKTEWFEDNALGFDTDNGKAVSFHTGGKYDSYLQIPFIPPKYQVGEYIYEDP